MELGKLVKMANQIGEFFAAEADAQAAELGIAEHLRKFWAPSMRSELLDALDRPGAAEALTPLARSALQHHRDALMVSPRR